MRGKGEGAVFKDSRGYWTAVIELPKENGDRKRKFIRRKLKKDLMAELEIQKANLKKRGYLPDANMTVEQWFTYWLEQQSKEVRPNTYDGYMRSVKNHIIPVIGSVKMARVSHVEVRRVTDEIMREKLVKGEIKAGLSSTTALLAHRIMTTAFKQAVFEQRMLNNPTDNMKKPRKAVAPQEAFELEEAIKVLEHVAKDPVMGARWATALFTGARRGEVLGLEIDRVNDVIDLSWQLQRLSRSTATGQPIVPADFEYRHLSGSLYLTRPKSKAGWREIPMFEPLATVLRRHIENSEPNRYGLVFTNQGRPIDPTKDSKNWKKVLAETGIEKDVKLHGLRHTAADLLFFAGMPEDLIQDVLGQSTRATTRGYKTKGKTARLRMDAALSDFGALFMKPIDARSATPLELDQ